MIQWLRYVPHHLVGPMLAKGWTISDDMQGTHHGNYSVIMIWRGEGEPPR